MIQSETGHFETTSVLHTFSVLPRKQATQQGGDHFAANFTCGKSCAVRLQSSRYGSVRKGMSYHW